VGRWGVRQCDLTTDCHFLVGVFRLVSRLLSCVVLEQFVSFVSACCGTWQRSSQRLYWKKTSLIPVMAHANVSNGILTIIASFSNGLDVLRKLRQSNKKSPKRTKTAKRNDEDALQLSRSLRHGPEEIGREYQAGSMRCDSERYAMGDGRYPQESKLQ
jgi:hypothetical protein